MQNKTQTLGKCDTFLNKAEDVNLNNKTIKHKQKSKSKETL